MNNRRKKALLLLIVLALTMLAGVLAACDKEQAVTNITVTYVDGEGVVKTAVFDKNFALEKEGMNFIGWYTDAALTLPLAGTPLDGATLYAKFERKSYTVKFVDYNDAVIKVNGNDTQTVLWGDAAVAPVEPSRRGYDFTGWSAGFDSVKANLTVKAMYRVQTFGLTFRLGDKIVYTTVCEAGVALSTYFNSAQVALEEELLEGLAFEGWYSDSELTIPATLTGNMPANEAKFYAKLKIAPLGNLSISSDKGENPVYASDLQVKLSATLLGASQNLEYTYAWRKGTTSMGNESFITLSGLSAGKHTYEVTVTATAEGCQNVVKTATFTVNVLNANITDVSLKGVEAIYDGTHKAITLTGTLSTDTVSYKINNGAWQSTAPSIKNAGAHTVYVRVARANHNVFEASTTINISRAVLTVTATDKAAVYGGALPQFTWTAAGFTAGDDESVISGTAVFGHAANTLTVGQSDITVSGLSALNYLIEYKEGTLTVGKASLTVTVNGQQVTFGDGIPEFSVAFEGFVNGEDERVLSGELAFYTIYTAGSNVGGYQVTADGLTSDNYSITFVEGTLTVNRAVLTVKADDKVVTYGDGLPEFSVAFADFVNGEDKSVLSGTLTFETAYKAGAKVGSYAITPKGLTSDNYEISFEAGTLTVEKASLTVTVNGQTVTFGDGIPEFSATFAGFVNGEDKQALSGTLGFNTKYIVGSDADIYEVTAHGLVSENYDIQYIAGSLTVEKKGIIVIGESKETVYGTAAPNFTVAYSGLIGVAPEILAGGFIIECNYNTGDNAGKYDIIVTGDAEFKNYKVVGFEKGVLTVAKKDIIAIAQNKETVYGAEAPVFTFEYEGLLDGIPQIMTGAINLTSSYLVGSKADSYEISISGNAEFENYKIAQFRSGTLTVGARDLTIVVNDRFASDGETAWEKSSWTGLGLVSDDTLTGTLKTTAASAGSYTAQGALGNLFAWVDLKITNATGDDVTACYKLIYNVSVEIVEDAFQYSATGAATAYDGKEHGITVTTTLATAVISYSLDGENYTAENHLFINNGVYTVYYMIEDSEGILSAVTGTASVSITKAVLTIKADDVTVTYGGGNPEFSATFAGFVNGENESVLSGTLGFETQYTVGANVDSYEITPVGLTADNYSIEFKAGILKVEQKRVEVSVVGAQITYGQALAVVYELSYDGFILGDDEGCVNTSALKFVSDYAVGSGVGSSYYVMASGLSAKNYSFDYSESVLNVTPATLTITATDKAAVYGGALPQFTWTATGFTAGDDESVISGTAVFGHAANTLTVGQSEITVSGLSLKNYVITYQNGTLTVNRAQLTVTANNVSVTFGDGIPEFSATFEGFVNGENKNVLSGTIAFETAYTAGANVGSYAVTPGGLTSSNYDIRFASGTLTVGQKQVAVVWQGLDRNYIYTGADQSAAIKATFDGNEATLIFGGQGTSFIGAGAYTVEATATNGNYILTNTQKSVSISKADYAGITHPTITGVYSPAQTLAQLNLNKGFSWADGVKSIVPECGETAGFAAYYNGDTANYNDFSLLILVSLEKATATINIPTAIDGYDFDGAAHGISNAVIEGIEVLYGGAILDKTLYTLVIGGNNSYIVAGTYGVDLVFESKNYKVINPIAFLKIKGVEYNGVKYTVEDALAVATSGTIIVRTDTSFAAGQNKGCYGDNKYYTVRSGVQLLVPYDDAATTTMNGISADADAQNGLGVAYVTLTIPDGVNVTISGTFNVNALRGNFKTAYMGHTIFNYGFVTMEKGSVMTLKSGAVLNCTGFISGDGVIVAESGAKAYDVMAIKDWRGGKVTRDIYEQYFPFNQYAVANIEAELKLSPGAQLIGRYMAYTSVATVNSEMAIVASGAMFEIQSGYLTKKVNADTGKISITVYGNASTNAITLTLKLGTIFASTVNISTANLDLPLCGYYSLVVAAGSVLDINNRFSLLPGASVLVEEGATVNINSGGAFRAFTESGKFSNGLYVGSVSPAYSEASSKSYTRLNKAVYKLSDVAKITVNGTINIAGTIGGLIETGGTGRLVFAASAKTTSTMTTNLNVTKVNTFSVEFSFATMEFTARGKREDGTEFVFEAGKTYVATSDGKWVLST